MLWQHGAAHPVARSTRLSVLDGELRGTAEFPPAGTSELADEVWRLVKSGVINAVSVGFDPIESEPLDAKRPRDGLRITRSELLEISLVSVPADTGAVITERAHRTGSRLMTDHLIKAEESVAEAARHHHDLGRAMERGDRRSAAASHRELGRCLRSAQAAFARLADEAALQDVENTSKAQTSAGVTYGHRTAAAPASASRSASWSCCSSPGQRSATVAPAACSAFVIMNLRSGWRIAAQSPR